MRQSGSSKFLWFVAGLSLGAAAGLVLAPAPGARTRRKLAETIEGRREYFSTSGREYIDKGRELYDKGRRLADEAAEMFDEGRRLVEG